MSLLQWGAGAGRPRGRPKTGLQHNTPRSARGSGGVREAVALVGTVAKRLRGGPSTAAQDNDLRGRAVLAGGDGDLRPVGPHDPDGPLHNQRPIGFGRDGRDAHAGNDNTAAGGERRTVPQGILGRQSMRTWSVLPLSLFAVACVSERGPLTNRMAQSTTRYLARAARQPVGWQPWGRDAFALAGRLDRPVLLYIGADECRWCTQMDREVYIDPALGALIDSFFVPVRVDRDERPDVAQHYQAAVQALAGLHGYPLTVFLTPDGAAFFGGTYFPADDPVTGRGLKQILPEIARSYRDQRPFIVQHAALVRQLALGKTGMAHGVLQPQALRLEVGNVRAALEVLRS